MRHLSFFAFILIFITSSCNDELVLSEQNSKVSTVHSCFSINAFSFECINNIGHTKFEVECLEAGHYYLCAWTRIPIINGCLHEYKVEINGVINENTLKPSCGGYVTLAM